MKHVYTYMRPSRGSHWYTIEMDINWDDDPARVAEECAEDYHVNHDGWESVWPMEFLITLTDGRQVRCYVERDVEPVFRGEVIPDKPGAPK